jgi:site-specific DNA-methyltransferase (adenine-specific)
MSTNKYEVINDDFDNHLHNIDEDFTIITDPPYNINFKYNEYNDNLEDSEYIDLISKFKGFKTAIIHYPEETMKYFVPALGVPDEVNVWAYNSNLPSRQSRLINYYNVKPNYNNVLQPFKNPNDKRIKKQIEAGKKGVRSYDWFSDIQMVKNVSKSKYNHPCPVPVKLMERIILLTTKEGDLVVDPFCGSGTTGVACLNTGRRFLGFEIDKTYYSMAQERLFEHTEHI